MLKFRTNNETIKKNSLQNTETTNYLVTKHRNHKLLCYKTQKPQIIVLQNGNYFQKSVKNNKTVMKT